jgi:hypothetical protein
MVFRVALVALLSVVVPVSGQVNSCYAASPNFYFVTKTSYKFIKNTNTDEITLPGIIQVNSNH